MPYQQPKDDVSVMNRQTYKWSDIEYEDHTIEKVELHEKNGVIQSASLTFDGSCGINTGPITFAPKVGQTLRLYGKGFGYTVRGMDIGGREVYYFTPDEDKARHKAMLDDQRREREALYEANREDYEKRIAALPKFFQDRIARFRRKNPANFNVDFLPYELFCCEQAVAFADALKTVENVQKFHGLPYDEQRKMVPGMDDGHSGNTFGCACSLASTYLSNPELVKFQHGSMVPLVGSDDFGSTIDEEEKAELKALGVEVQSV